MDERHAIVVVGGASLNLLGLASRTTDDVDIIASASSEETNERRRLYAPPEPLPEALQRAIETVARDFNFPTAWMNTDVASQWKQGLPPWIEEDITWRQFDALDVGLAGRRTLVALKLFAAVDSGPESVHYQDLLTLNPSPEGFREAAEWVRTQDAAPEFAEMVDQVIQSVQRDVENR